MRIIEDGGPVIGALLRVGFIGSLAAADQTIQRVIILRLASNGIRTVYERATSRKAYRMRAKPFRGSMTADSRRGSDFAPSIDCSEAAIGTADSP